MARRILAGIALVLIAAVVTIGVRTNHSYVTTPSMYPTIPPGSEIFVTPQQHYHVGQVIEFHANGLTWAHRLIKIDKNGDFHTKGDNPENAPDVFVPALTQKDVVGAVTHAPRWIGFPELILKHPGYGMSWLRAELGLRGKLLLIGVVALLAILPGLVGRRLRRVEPLADSTHNTVGAARRLDDSAPDTLAAIEQLDIKRFVSDDSAVLAYAVAIERARRNAPLGSAVTLPDAQPAGDRRPIVLPA